MSIVGNTTECRIRRLGSADLCLQGSLSGGDFCGGSYCRAGTCRRLWFFPFHLSSRADERVQTPGQDKVFLSRELADMEGEGSLIGEAPLLRVLSLPELLAGGRCYLRVGFDFGPTLVAAAHDEDQGDKRRQNFRRAAKWNEEKFSRDDGIHDHGPLGR